MIDLWIKAFVRFPMNIGRANSYLSNKKAAAGPAASAPPVVLDLRTPQLLFDSGRHPACLANNARLAGSTLLLRCSRLLLAEISRKQFGEALLSDPQVTWLRPSADIAANSLVLYDAAKPPSDIGPDTRAFAMMIGRDVLPDSLVMPYPMHPTTLSMLDRYDLDSLRASQRNVQLFFAGTRTERYGHARIEQDFGVQSRTALLDTLRRHRGDRIRRSLAQARSEAIVLADSRADPIAAEDWLPTLAETEFFLCCPGAAQPMCHNVIEAMSVGTIPVIEYGDRFTPPLTDGVNAICFRGLSGLINALDRIDGLSANQLAALRQNVVRYYENHLRGDRFLANLRDGKITSVGGQISMPFNDTNLFRDSSPRSPRRAA